MLIICLCGVFEEEHPLYRLIWWSGGDECVGVIFCHRLSCVIFCYRLSCSGGWYHVDRNRQGLAYHHTQEEMNRKQSQMRRIARSQMRRQKTLPTDAPLSRKSASVDRPAARPPQTTTTSYYHDVLTAVAYYTNK